MKKLFVLSLITSCLLLSKVGTAGSASVSASNGGYDIQNFYIDPMYSLTISFYAYVPSTSGYDAYITANWPSSGGNPYTWYGYLGGNTSPNSSYMYDGSAQSGNLNMSAYTSGSGSQASAYANW